MNRCQWIISLRHLLVGHSKSPSQGSDLVLWTAPRWECKPCVVHQFDSDDARQVEPRLGRWHKVKISYKRGIWSIWDMGQDIGPCEDTVFSLFVFCSTHTHLDFAWLGLGLEAALGLLVSPGSKNPGRAAFGPGRATFDLQKCRKQSGDGDSRTMRKVLHQIEQHVHSLLTLYLHFKVDFCILGRLQIPKMSASKKLGNLSRNGSFDRLASEFNEQVCGPEFGKIPGTSLTTGDFEAEPLAL